MLVFKWCPTSQALGAAGPIPAGGPRGHTMSLPSYEHLAEAAPKGVKNGDVSKHGLFSWSNSRRAWVEILCAREERLKSGSEECERCFCKWLRHEQLEKQRKLDQSMTSLTVLQLNKYRILCTSRALLPRNPNGGHVRAATVQQGPGCTQWQSETERK